ncbi:hypothetical protein [Mesobacillus zeae]|uniref:hypothetical protein n=1 Tax=Mesobacillus zeae TaxID=1917180 RepID=UPI003008326A
MDLKQIVEHAFEDLKQKKETPRELIPMILVYGLISLLVIVNLPILNLAWLKIILLLGIVSLLIISDSFFFGLYIKESKYSEQPIGKTEQYYSYTQRVLSMLFIIIFFLFTAYVAVVIPLSKGDISELGDKVGLPFTFIGLSLTVFILLDGKSETKKKEHKESKLNRCDIDLIKEMLDESLKNRLSEMALVPSQAEKPNRRKKKKRKK